MTKHVTHSLVAVPLMVRGEVIGVLEALNKKDDAHYTEEDLTILETLGALAAQAMQNVDLQRKVRALQDRTCRTGTPQNRLYRDHLTRASHSPGLDPRSCHIPARTDLASNMANSWIRSFAMPPSSRISSKIFRMWITIQNGAARVRSQKVSLAKIAEDVVATFQDEANSRNITLKAEMGDSPFHLDADGVKISIALSNLVKNAHPVHRIRRACHHQS